MHLIASQNFFLSKKLFFKHNESLSTYLKSKLVKESTPLCNTIYCDRNAFLKKKKEQFLKKNLLMAKKKNRMKNIISFYNNIISNIQLILKKSIHLNKLLKNFFFNVFDLMSMRKCY